MNVWLEATRLTVAATSVSRAERAFDIALDWSATRKQFGKVIGKFQGISFKLADMATNIKAANLLRDAFLKDQKTIRSVVTELFESRGIKISGMNLSKYQRGRSFLTNK